MNRLIKYIFVWFTILVMSSCHDFLEPKSQSEYVPKLASSLNELLLGEAYMGCYYGNQLFSVLGLFDDDVAIRKEWQGSDESEKVVAEIRLLYTWSGAMKDELSDYNTYGQVYDKIMGCNAVLDYINDAQGTQEAKNYVKGQALALRGYFYWFLVNLYGQPYSYNPDALGVPLKLTSNLEINGVPRNSVKEVYDQIVKDLLEAERLYMTLPQAEQNLHNNRVNLAFIHLMLSRVYLYMENWDQVLVYGKKVIENYNYDILDLRTLSLPNRYADPSYMEYFTYDNPEVIFLFGNYADILQRTHKWVNHSSGINIITVASENLVNSYEDTDLRKQHYLVQESDMNSTYRRAFSKFPVGFDFNLNVDWGAGYWGIAFKVTEAYLNVAEAAAMLYKSGKGECQSTVQNLMERLREKRFAAGTVGSINISNPDELIHFVREERRRELCFENHRWFDLRRYGMEELKHVWYDQQGVPTEYVLQKNDPAFTLLLPEEVFEHNSAIVQNEDRK